MFEETKLFGISMSPRANRRWLVVVTYAATAVLMSAQPIALVVQAQGWLARFVSNLGGALWFILLLLIGRTVFGRFVRSGFRQFIGPPQRSVQTRLGLAASAPDDEPSVDEREAALRDRAYYIAYKGLAVGSLFLLAVLWMCVAFTSTWVAMSALTLATCVFAIVAFTLPQAVVLWTEPDLAPEEEPERTHQVVS